MFKRILHRFYHRFTSGTHWMRRRFTKAGWLVLAGLWLTAALGVDTSLSVAYQSFIFLALLMLTALLLSPLRRPRFSAERILPRFATANVPIRYRVRFRNRTPRRQRDLVLLEEFADPRPSHREYCSTPEPGEERRNWFDRKLGYCRWTWLISRRRLATVAETAIPPCPPRGEVEVEATLMPSRRGLLHFRTLTVAAPDPIGLFRSLRSIPLPGSMIILPRRYPMPRLPLPGTMKYQHGGIALAGSVGESEEFVSLRDYRPGDPLRHIHWKSWAKAGQPIVKEFQEEFFVRHALILDTFARNTFSDVFEDAVSIAASFACTVDTQDALLDLMFVGANAYCFTAGRGLAHAEQMLEILASVMPCGNRPFSELGDLVLEHAASVSGCVCIFLDWDEPRRELVETLRALSIPVSVFLVVEPGWSREVDRGPMRDAPGDFHVLESGRVAEALANL